MEQLQVVEQFVKLPVGTKVAAIAGVVALVTALNYFWLPVGDSISDIETRIQQVDAQQRKLNDELSEKTAITNNLNQFRHEKEVLEQKLAEAQSELPEESKLEDLLKEFQDRGGRAGLEISTIEPGTETPEGFYSRIPIPMTVVGNFHEIATFFDSLSRLRRIVNVGGISLDIPKDVNGKIVVTAKFVATTFMFNRKTGAGAGAAKPGAPGALPAPIPGRTP
jgi:type IV pilus assembly protein PilO